MRRVGAVRRWVPLPVVGLLVLALASTCSAGEPPVLGPSGVDGLTVPAVLPAPAGTYIDAPDGDRYLPLDTSAPLQEVDGVATRAYAHDGVVDLLAEDRAGNLWWFGREGEWSAGVDGARPGLFMPARPRRGDGFARAEVPGLVDDVATVESLAQGVLVLYVQSASDPASDRREVYEAGTGRVSPGAG